MDRIQLKEKAKRLVSEDRGYYFTITFVPMIILFIYNMIANTAGYISYVTSIMNMAQHTTNIEDFSSNLSVLMSFIGIGSIIGLLVSLVTAIIKFGVRILMLKSYRQEEAAGESGIEDSLYAFKDSRWLAALGFFVIIYLYQLVVAGAAGIILGLIAIILVFIGIAANNTIVTVILILIGILALVAVGIVAIILNNFTSQLNYAFLDASQKGDSFSGAISQSFKLMTKKDNMMQFFNLQASFIGWSILNELTFGILGIVWWNAYAEMTYAGFYDEIVKKEAQA
ncbi:DUF975 family protein [Holzapfeliella sp. He02]|uniref:DUF975 family protein n=1 Tax=Holzapfeliella saturejae TaxID=3082953 RepID=A0ABU8SHY8_9LACO